MTRATANALFVLPALAALLSAWPRPAAAQDTNGNLFADSRDMRMGTSQDCNHNGIPDESDSDRPHFSAAVEHLNALEQFTSYVWDACPIDFNLDGRPDVAAVSYPDPDFGYVTLWRNDGGAGLTYLLRFTLGVQLGRILAADMNNDGRSDLVVSDTAMTRVYVLRATGDATFAAPVTLVGDTSNNGLGGVAVGDLDNDGDLDVAASCWGQHTANVWRNNGNGTFGPRSSYPVGYNPRAVAIGDVTGDGLADIAVANSWEYAPPPVADGTVTILANTGIGFVTDATYTMPQNNGPYGVMRPRPRDLVLIDVDHDGDRDMIVSSRDSERLDLWLNNGGDLTLAGAIGTGYYLGSDAAAIVCTDLDGDGWEDVAWADAASYSVDVFKNDGGTFQFRQSFATGNLGSVSVTAADFDGDQRPDLLVSNHALRTFSILRNNGDLLFDAALRLRPSQYPGSTVLTDLTGDGITDFGAPDLSFGVTSFLVHPGVGDGTFATPIATSPVPSTGFFWARDLDHDGHQDLIAVQGQCRVFLGNGDGTFQAEITNPANVFLRNVVTDIDLDGHLDFVWISPGHPGTLYRSLGDGAGHFPAGTAVGIAPAEDESIWFGDISGDGAPEIFTGHAQGLEQPGGILSIYPNTGNGSFGTRQDRYIVAQPLSPAVDAIACADFDGDGDNDVVVSAMGLRLYSNTGTGFLPQTPQVVGPFSASILTVADIDLDGDSDLYGRAASGIAFLNNGSGLFDRQMIMHFYDSNARGMIIADLNNDGRQDMLIDPENSWDRYVYLNLPPNSPDCDGDGTPDECQSDNDGDGVPDACDSQPMPGDANGDGVVSVSDLMMVILDWGACGAGGEPCPADLDGDGVVNVLDLVIVINNW